MNKEREAYKNRKRPGTVEVLTRSGDEWLSWGYEDKITDLRKLDHKKMMEIILKTFREDCTTKELKTLKANDVALRILNDENYTDTTSAVLVTCYDMVRGYEPNFEMLKLDILLERADKAIERSYAPYGEFFGDISLNIVLYANKIKAVRSFCEQTTLANFNVSFLETRLDIVSLYDNLIELDKIDEFTVDINNGTGL